MENLNGLRRTNYCGDIRKDNINETVTLMGWVQKTRDFGSLEFIDLRDRSGIAQIVFNEELNKELYDKSKTIRQEYALAIVGKVVERQSKNPELATGDVEVIAEELRVLDVAKTPPIYIKDDDNVKEEMRLKYRYLDLRKTKMQDMLRKRAELAKLFRDFLYDNGFIEVETPMLGKPTPEGARDYLVPSRVNPHNFYALPQSPQLMKQLLMVGGTDRYYQIARCFRDEDLRANRQPEFTQVDIEMSFVTMEDVIEINEELICHLFKKFKGIELKRPFARMSYQDAISKYGSDKPDLRYGFEIHDISGISEKMDFDLFNDAVKNGDKINAINFNELASQYSRKKLDKLVSYAKGCGANTVLWGKIENGEWNTSFNKFLTDESKAFLEAELSLKNNDLFVLMVGEKNRTLEQMGQLRIEVAKNHVEFKDDDYAITWVVDFPMFEYSEEEDRYVAKHHPFTHPLDEDIEFLETAPEKVRAKAYDIVINGEEAGGGSIRINNSDLQSRIFKLLKLSEDDIQNRFGFFVEALQYGTPPHGGIAYGFDRFVMQMLNITNIKDVLAFPKTQSATDMLTEAPTTVTEEQLKELSISLD